VTNFDPEGKLRFYILSDSQYLLPNGVVAEEAADFSHRHGPEFIDK